MKHSAYAWIGKSLGAIHRANWHRSVLPLEGKGPVVTLAGQPVVNFASNDYLGLAGDPRLAQAATEAIRVYGTGSTGSRLLSGHRKLHRDLECAIAALKHSEDALVFSSGYLANLGTIAALVGPRDLIISDQYNHSSLINGARLSGATTVTYAHCSVESLQQQLELHRSRHRRCLIITDTVFSMDGDICPLPEILALGDHFDSMVLVDEAHGTGVLGSHGAGCVEYFDCCKQPLVQVGTLSKALGSLGGYVAGSAQLIDYLRNRAPSWIYTTGLTPADTAAALEAVEIVRSEPQRRSRLWQNIQFLQQELRQLATLPCLAEIRQLPSESAIICLEMPNAEAVLEARNKLLTQGLFVSAVRPPTTPTSRLRISLMANHEQPHLQQLMQGLMATADYEQTQKDQVGG